MKICTAAGCGAIVKKGKCAKHQAAPKQRPPIREKRESASARGYGAWWRKARVLHLRRHPLCVHHLERGFTVAATDVDHIIPLKGKLVSGLHVPSNLQVIPGVMNMSKGNKFYG